MAGTGIVKSMKDFYWDLRPKPEYGTIELRVCDTPLSVDRAAAGRRRLPGLQLQPLPGLPFRPGRHPGASAAP
jgi:carboxylate-amine ligase